MEKKVINLSKGLFTDTSKSLQPENTTPFVLNGQLESLDGDQNSYTNEKGNKLCYSLPLGFTQIGQINLLDDEFVVFGVSDSNSIIGTVDKFCRFTEVVRASCLNFSIQHQITGEFRLRRGCDRVIYFTDNFNALRYFNLDDIESFKSNGDWDCDKFNLFRGFQHPCFSDITVNNAGGSLITGTYQFAIQYLDANLNPTNWITISNVIPIVSGSLSAPYIQIEGGLGEETNKSVTLTISNIDTNFEYYRIGVISHLGGVTTATAKQPVVITGSTGSFLVQGDNPTQDIIVEPSEFSVPKITYHTAKAIKQIDNKLAIANIKDKKIDWSKFQQKAMQIRSEYQTKLFEASNMTNWSPKTSKYYNDTRSYMRDEVYAFGIVWIFNDGSYSPAFHIPGRSKITDSTLVAIGNSNIHNRPVVPNNDWDDIQVNSSSDTQHLPPQNTYDRWEIYNTAIRTNKNFDPNIPYFTKGEFAYYESTELYPETLDCDGNLVYGSDAGTPIRFHKFPDTTLEPHYISGSIDGTDNDYNSINFVDAIVPIGIQLYDIEPPVEYEDQVVGYKIVKSLRDEANSTVIDKGVLFENLKMLNDGNDLGYRQSYPYYKEPGGYLGINATLIENDDFRVCDDANTLDPDNLSFSFHSPKSKFSNILSSDFLKIEREVGGELQYYLFDNSGTSQNFLSKVQYRNTNIPSNINTNRFITAQSYVDALSETSGNLSDIFFNQNSQETYVVELGTTLSEPSTLLDNIYTPSIFGAFIRTEGTVNSHAYYVSSKKYNPRMYGNLAGIIYHETTPCYFDKTQTTLYNGSTVLFGGDTFISILWIRKTFEGGRRDDCGDTEIDTRDERALFGIWMESTINSELRNEGLLNADTTLSVNERCDEGYYPKTFDDGFYTQTGKTREYLDRNSTCINSYLYNDDYSKENQIVFHFPLSATFKFCIKCLNEYKNRVAVSQTAFQEEVSDNYRTFLANNYKDIPAEKGEITNLMNKKNKLFIHTENSFFYQDIKPQQLRTDQATLYVATGEVLEQPIYEITTSDNGYAGSINRTATINTPYGIFFISANDRKIFNFAENLDEISNTGISNWLQNNMNLEYRDQIKRVLGLTIDSDNPANPNGIGYVSCFDKMNDRILISKKDFLFIDESLIKGYTNSTLNNLGYYDLNGVLQFQQNNDIYYDTDNNYYFIRINAETKQVLNLTNTTYFRNISWTLSYHIKGKTFASYHSYLPNHLFATNNKVYSHIGSNQVFEHNVGEYLQYYNQYKPFIVEHVINKNYLQTQLYPSIQYLSDITKDNINYSNDTFTKAWMYNDYQSTGILSIIRKDISPYSTVTLPSSVLVARNEREWSINKYRDIVDQPTNPQSIFSVDWNSISTSYYIDKIPNSTIHNPNKSVYTKERLRDVYMVARMIYENTEDKKIQIRFLLPNVTDTP